MGITTPIVMVSPCATLTFGLTRKAMHAANTSTALIPRRLPSKTDFLTIPSPKNWNLSITHGWGIIRLLKRYKQAFITVSDNANRAKQPRGLDLSSLGEL